MSCVWYRITFQILASHWKLGLAYNVGNKWVCSEGVGIMVGNDFSFATFSKNEFYSTLNARLVDMADVGSDRRVVDLACGAGGVTRLILQRINRTKDTVVIALDHSSLALRTAMEDLKDISNNAVKFVQLGVENVSEAVKDSVDTIVFCNAIHYVPDKD